MTRTSHQAERVPAEPAVTALSPGQPVPTRRRERTRQRMLDAAFEVFAARGFGRATVEDVCDAAGFTRGAFYSNFASLDELFFALYEQRAGILVTQVTEALAKPTRAGDDDGRARELIDHVLGALGTDQAWYMVNAEFTVHALRHPEVAGALARHRKALREALIPALVAVTAGRTLPTVAATPQLLARTVVAIHEGTANQLLIEPGSRSLRAWRRDLLLLVVGTGPRPSP